jgi:hypothetical protein
LQTERDKARVIEGLEGIAAGTGQKFDSKEMEQILAGLSNRIFLLNNTHEDSPEVFETRWAMSYLRGPLTRTQITTLMDPLKDRSQVEARQFRPQLQRQRWEPRQRRRARVLFFPPEIINTSYR